MNKILKTALIISSIIVVFIMGGLSFNWCPFDGTFNFVCPKEIATYNSPDNEFFLIFEQMGEPQWPFGSTDIRLTLKNHDGKIMERVSTQLLDDGANASEHNIESVSWNDKAVTIVLKASEMEEKEITIAYNKSSNPIR